MLTVVPSEGRNDGGDALDGASRMVEGPAGAPFARASLGDSRMVAPPRSTPDRGCSERWPEKISVSAADESSSSISDTGPDSAGLSMRVGPSSGRSLLGGIPAGYPLLVG